MKTLTTLTAALSLTALPLLAHEHEDHGAPDAAAVEAAAETLGLTDTTVQPEARGPDLIGTLPGGAQVELDFHQGGSVEEIEAAENSYAPIAEVTDLLPDVLKDAERFPADGEFESIDLDNDGFDIEGRDADGTRFEAEYDAEGALLEWEAQ